MRDERRYILPLCMGLAVVFFAANHVGILAGWLMPTAGHEPTFLNRASDIAQYLTWGEAFRTAWLIPNYHAPWDTEAVYFNPVFFVLSRLSVLTGLSFVVVYHAAHLLAVLLCGYALARCVLVFTEGRQAYVAIAAALCSVPVYALAATVRPPAGMGGFLHYGHDAFFHGIPGGVPTALGTGLALLSFALLGEYLRGSRLWSAAVVTSIGAFLHPFEVFVVVTAGGLALLYRRDVRGALTVGASGGLGLVPYAAMALSAGWVGQASANNIFVPDGVGQLALALGLPTLVALVMFAVRRLEGPSDVLLQAWVLTTLALVYLPLPWTQHLFDGYHYAVGMLVTRQLWPFRHRALQAAGGGVLALSLAAYPVYWLQAARDGNEEVGEYHTTTVRPVVEGELIQWLRANAEPTDLVIAPPDLAPWLATVPMRSLASHWVFSLTYNEQRAFADRLYEGDTTGLGEWGARYVVSRAGFELRNYTLRTVVGEWRVLEAGATPAP